MKKKISVFWCIYSALLLVFVGCLIFGAKSLTEYLAAFEQSQPIHRAEEIFETYFSGDDFSLAMEAAQFTPSEFESAKEANALICQMKEGKEIAFYSAVKTEEEICYHVVLVEEGAESEEAGDEISVQGIPSEKIASFYLTKSNEADKYGFFPYEFSRMEMFLEPSQAVCVTLPADSELYLNGTRVGEDYVKEREEHRYNEFLPEGVPGITLVTYEVKGLCLEPEISAVDRGGIAHQLTYSEKSGAYTAALNYSSELQESQGERILSGMKEFAKRMQNDGNVSATAAYFDKESLFYKNIAANASVYVTEHESYEFRNEKAEDFYAFDENTFCCHVALDHVLHSRGKADYVDEIDMIVFAKKINGKFYIYDRIVQ